MQGTSLRTDITAEVFAGAVGFPHAIVDDFLASSRFHEVADEFPAPAVMPEHGRTPAYSKDVAGDLAPFGPATRGLVEELQSPAWVEHLVEITGIPGLVADLTCAPHLAHATPTGGYTRIHRDSLRHPACPLFRRVAFILYLHHEWEDAWGGEFEIWDGRLRTKLAGIAPSPNRAVIFATTPHAWHGFPDPIACPPGWSRRALTLWYWTDEQPPGRPWRRADGAAKFRRRRQSADPTDWAMRQRTLRQVLVPAPVRRVLRRLRHRRS